MDNDVDDRQKTTAWDRWFKSFWLTVETDGFFKQSSFLDDNSDLNAPISSFWRLL